MLALALWFVAEGRASGQPALHYEAPSQCPGKAFFLASLRARLNADGMRARAGARLSVKLEQSGASARGRVRIELGALRAHRRLAADTCKEVAEGLALIAALAIAEPRGVRGVVEGDDDQPSTTPQASAVDASSTPGPQVSPAESAGRSPGGAATRSELEAVPAEPSPSTRARASEPTVIPAEPSSTHGVVAAAIAEPRDADPLVEPPVSLDQASTLRWSLEAGLVGVHGIAPELQPGLQLEAAVVFASGVLDWSVRLGGRAALPAEQHRAQGTTRFGFWSGLVQLCAARSWSSRTPGLYACAVAEPGLYLAAGTDTDNAHDYRRAWFAAGGGVGATFALARWFGLRAGAELLLPVRRDRALLAGEAVHRVPLMCVRLFVGAEVALP